MTPIDITFSLSDFPTLFSGTQEDFKAAFVRTLRAQIDSAFLVIPGRIGGIAPLSNIGPWFASVGWKTWDDTAHAYRFNTVAVGNENFLVRLDGSPTNNHTLLLQDKSGIAATTDDLYLPRHTYDIPSGGTLYIDWNASDTFYHELDQATFFRMINSRHGQEIYVAIMNPSNYDITFDSTVGFIDGVQPVASKAVGGTLTDVTTFNTSKLIISAMASFAQSDVGRTISTAGNTPIPASTTIATVLSPTHALISNAAVANGTNVTATITSRLAVGRTDLWVFKNVGGSIYGRVIQGYQGLLRAAGTALAASSSAIPIPPPPPAPTPILLAPSFNPAPGHEHLVPDSLTITMMVAAPAVAIRYTTDGTIPTATVGNLVSSTVASYVLAQGDTVEITAIAIGSDNSVSAYKRAIYSNVYTVPDTTNTVIPDNVQTGQARIDVGVGGGLMPTKLQ